jgi:hypothetical protein
MLAFWG